MMGTFRATVRVFSLEDPTHVHDLKMFAATGATPSIVPRPVLVALGVGPPPPPARARPPPGPPRAPRAPADLPFDALAAR